MDLVEEHRDDRADQAGDRHGHDQRHADTARDEEGFAPEIALEQVDIRTEEGQCHQRKDHAVEQADPDFLEQELQLFAGGQLLVHQDTDGDRQRLGADIAGHIQHHRLEADDDGQHRHHRLEHSDHRGNHHAEEQQGDQPRQTLLDALQHRLVQIFLAGQTAEFCVVVAHLVVHDLHDVCRGDDAQQRTAVVQHGQGFFGIFGDPIQTFADLFVVGHIGVRAADDILQLVARPCHDQVFQVDGTVVFFRFIHHIQGRDVVVFARLLDQLAHGLPDGQILADADVVGGHAAADLVLIVGHQQPDIFRRILIQMFDQLLLVVLFQIFQCVHRVVRVHAGNDLCRLIRRQFLQIRLGIVQIGEDLCHTIHT